MDEEAGEKVAAVAAIALLALLAGAIVYASSDPVRMANNAMSQAAIAADTPASAAGQILPR
jgi:hypothetical protein